MISMVGLVRVAPRSRSFQSLKGFPIDFDDEALVSTVMESLFQSLKGFPIDFDNFGRSAFGQV